MKLYVGNLSSQVNDAQLSDLAKPYGTLVSANVAVDRSNGVSKGFGFIEFSNADEGRAAIAGLNGKEVDGRALKVDAAKPKTTAAPGR
ncbi:MAG TPA: RNA-binding protein [Thermoanaerobaculia bacterium]|nr:RNA-binding protein [Thermoanaerobaculia bacterium]